MSANFQIVYQMRNGFFWFNVKRELTLTWDARRKLVLKRKLTAKWGLKLKIGYQADTGFTNGHPAGTSFKNWLLDKNWI